MNRRKRPICEYVAEEFYPKLREAIKLTDEHGIEHGFTIIGEPGDVTATNIISGEEQSINIASGTTTAFRPIRIGVHTHPTGSVVLSDADWQSFFTEYAQHPPDADFPIGWGLGMVVAGRPPTYGDEFRVRGVELTPAAANKSADEQRELVDHAFETISTPQEWALKSSEDRVGKFAPDVSMCTREVPLEGGFDA